MACSCKAGYAFTKLCMYTRPAGPSSVSSVGSSGTGMAENGDKYFRNGSRTYVSASGQGWPNPAGVSCPFDIRVDDARRKAEPAQRDGNPRQ